MEPNTKNGIKLIAEKAGVSIGTVDRVLHNRPGVNKETRDRVLRIIKELNYQPNILARRLVSKKKFRFAAIIPSQNSNSFWSAHKMGIERANAEISQYGVSIDTLTFNQDDPDTFSQCIEKTFEVTYDGVLMVPFFTKQSESFVKACERLQTPCVFIDTNLSVEETSSLAFIGQNAQKSGYFASRFFSYLVKPEDEVLMVSINATKIADNHVNYMMREEGFRKHLSESQAFSIREFTYNDPDLSKLDEALLTVLQQNEGIKGIFVTNSRSYKVADIVESNNLRGKYRILGYDLSERNVEHLKKGNIDFLISQDPMQQGYLGIQALYRKLILNEEIFAELNMPIDLITKDNLEFYRNNN